MWKIIAQVALGLIIACVSTHAQKTQCDNSNLKPAIGYFENGYGLSDCIGQDADTLSGIDSLFFVDTLNQTWLRRPAIYIYWNRAFQSLSSVDSIVFFDSLAQPIQFLSPVEGEEYHIGDTLKIQWVLMPAITNDTSNIQSFHKSVYLGLELKSRKLPLLCTPFKAGFMAFLAIDSLFYNGRLLKDRCPIGHINIVLSDTTYSPDAGCMDRILLSDTETQCRIVYQNNYTCEALNFYSYMPVKSDGVKGCYFSIIPHLK